MNNIYVVQGSTGEYSDRTEWLVYAFKDEDVAKEYVKMLEDKVLSLGAKYGDHGYWDNRNEITEEMKNFDSNFNLDYTGTTYYYTKVELK